MQPAVMRHPKLSVQLGQQSLEGVIKQKRQHIHLVVLGGGIASTIV